MKAGLRARPAARTFLITNGYHRMWDMGTCLSACLGYQFDCRSKSLFHKPGWLMVGDR